MGDRRQAITSRSSLMRAIAVASVLVSFGIVAPARVHAECNDAYPWPSFSSTASMARAIVIGTVTNAPPTVIGDAFAFEVTESLRGNTPTGTAAIDAPITQDPDSASQCPYSVLDVAEGDELALAFGRAGVADRIRGPLSAVAFVSNVTDREPMPGMEQLTLDEIRAVDALPDTSAAETRESTVALTLSAPVVFAAALLSVRLFRRRFEVAER